MKFAGYVAYESSYVNTKHCESGENILLHFQRYRFAYGGYFL